MSNEPGSAATPLEREVRDLRYAVLRILDIMEADKRRTMRFWTAYGVAALVAFVVVVVTHA